MELNLKGKKALITGGGSGLGAEITKAFSAEGVDTAVNYIVDEENVFQLVESIKQTYGTNCIAVKGDISCPKDVSSNIDEVIAKLGQIDILINNAGVWPMAYVKDMRDEDWDRTISINLSGSFYFSKRVVQHLLNRNSPGKIISVVSQAAFHGSTSGHAHYAASKGGLVTFTVSLAREVAKHNITVNAVAPGIMKTHMIQDALSDHGNDYLARIPLGRVADPSEIADVVVFLASARADYITGATIDVSGGMIMR